MGDAKQEMLDSKAGEKHVRRDAAVKEAEQREPGDNDT